ncbi:MAG: hypothetical protein GTO40_23795 [Deltaproteobacteria bacterium]|nr:hypothetical protein [Deltaproteobacteria bacterium]
MTHANPRRHYFYIWLWLMAFLILSVVASLLVNEFAALVLIFVAALIKAVLVLRSYMHLKYEHLFIYALAVVPFVIMVIFALSLFPDFVLNTR